MGIFDFFSSKPLSPTCPQEQRFKVLVSSIENYAFDLHKETNLILDYGDYTDGLRLLLILEIISSIKYEPRIGKIDKNSVSQVLEYYNSTHWANQTPCFIDLITSISIFDDRIQLMEMELDRSILSIDGQLKDTPGTLQWIYNNSTTQYTTWVPSIHKKLRAGELVYACRSFSWNLVGKIYGSERLLEEGEGFSKMREQIKIKTKEITSNS